MNKDQRRRQKRIVRVRKRLYGTSQRPRLSVRKTNRHLHIQIIDDERGATLLFASTFAKDQKIKKSRDGGSLLGEKVAKQALEKKITAVVFDRGPSTYHGILAAFANGARKGGLQF